MKLGLFTPVFARLGLEDMLAKVRSLGRVTAIELGTGAWPGSDHVDVDAEFDVLAVVVPCVRLCTLKPLQSSDDKTNG